METRSANTVLTDFEAGILTITLNRPGRRNAIDRQMLDALARALEIMGMERALEESLRADIAVEAAGTPEKAEFLEIIRTTGLRAAVEWRDRRWAQTEP